jgi:hypothetical protein
MITQKLHNQNFKNHNFNQADLMLKWRIYYGSKYLNNRNISKGIRNLTEQMKVPKKENRFMLNQKIKNVSDAGDRTRGCWVLTLHESQRCYHYTTSDSVQICVKKISIK